MTFPLFSFGGMNCPTKNINTLLFLAIIGVTSILFSDFPILNKFSIPKWAILIQPLMLSVLLMLLGTYSLNKTSYPFKFKNQKELLELDQKGIIVSVVLSFPLGVILFLITPYFESLLPNFLKEFKISIITKVFYGGLNEELIMRLGLLSFLYLICKKFFTSLKSKIFALVISSILFALGHLPILFIDGTPNFNSVVFVISVNVFFGLIYGYLYMKYNLTASFIAHASTHIVHYLLIMVLI